ncbi:MAG: flagellar basal body P-ring protein FlgI [Firmicutes bacterium]|nr:flagellar basal body P-ring protein FlgI [Bacillota bacterium]
MEGSGEARRYDRENSRGRIPCPRRRLSGIRSFAAILLLVAFSLACSLASSIVLFDGRCFAGAMRVKDIARVQGVRVNQLMGYGLVVGLDGTGDSRQSMFTVQSVANMLARFGVTVPPESIRVRNVAAVIVTADLPPFVKNGDQIDVNVASLGDARTIQGGTLLLTPLLGPDGKTYAVAQGPVSIGGLNMSGGGRQSRNYPTGAMIPRGAVIEREVPMNFVDEDKGTVAITLNQPDFTTASRLVAAINAQFGQGAAQAVDAGTVQVNIPTEFKGNAVGFIARIEELTISPDTVAKVAINERTGTVVIGGEVRLLPAVISHGNLRVEITSLQASPGPPSVSGVELSPAFRPARRGSSDQPGSPGTGSLVKLGGGETIDSLVSALNAIGASPRDIIAILQALRAAGSLQAELEVI